MAVVASDTFNRRNQGVRTDESIAAWLDIARAARAGRHARPGHGLGRVRLPVRRRGSRRRASSTSAQRVADARAVRDCARRHDRRRRACAGHRARGAGARGRAGHRHCAAISTTRATPASPMPTPRLQAGVRTLDASLGGIGGCPFAPAATGNIRHRGSRLHAASLRLSRPASSLDAAIETGKWLQEQLGRRRAGHARRRRAAFRRRPRMRLKHAARALTTVRSSTRVNA